MPRCPPPIVRSLFHGGLLLLLALSAVSLAGLYAGSERFFYYWDHAGFVDVTLEQAYLSRTDPDTARRLLQQSMSQDYPRIYTILPVMLLKVLGETRTACIVAFTLVYQLPFLLLIGGIVAELVPHRRPLAFWSTAFGTLLIPTLWFATLRGYPDIGASALFAGAILLYLLHLRLQSRVASSICWVAMGTLLAATPLFRRHFAFAVACFILFSVVDQSIRAVLAKRATGDTTALGMLLALIRPFAKFIALAVVISAILGTIGRDWVTFAMSADRSMLYSSYTEPVSRVVSYFADNYGYLIWALVALGWIVALARLGRKSAPALWVGLLAACTMIHWIVLVRISSPHFLLHSAELVAVGFGLLFVTFFDTVKSTSIRVLCTAATAIFLIINLVVSFAALQPPAPIAALFSAPHSPLIRHDFDEVVRLVNDLRQKVTLTDQIFVIDSSALMNDDLLRKADEQLFGRDNRKLVVQLSPHIDSRDFLPLNNLLFANFVLVSTPFRPEQSHMSTPQLVVQAGARAIHEWPLSRLFERLPDTYLLTDRTTYALFRRIAPNDLATTLQTLALMRDFVQPPPPNSTDWMILQEPFPSSISKDGSGTVTVHTHLGTAGTDRLPPIVGYLNQTGPRGRLQFKLEYIDEQGFRNASAARVRVLSADAAAATTEVASITTVHGERITPIDLKFDLPPGCKFVLLEISAAGDTPSLSNGTLTLRQLQLTFP